MVGWNVVFFWVVVLGMAISLLVVPYSFFMFCPARPPQSGTTQMLTQKKHLLGPTNYVQYIAEMFVKKVQKYSRML